MPLDFKSLPEACIKGFTMSLLDKLGQTNKFKSKDAASIKYATSNTGFRVITIKILQEKPKLSALEGNANMYCYQIGSYNATGPTCFVQKLDAYQLTMLKTRASGNPQMSPQRLGLPPLLG